jgi:glycosyltransferase involved in cell wall biosynthesis
MEAERVSEFRSSESRIIGYKSSMTEYQQKPVILCFVAVYLPGFRSGGPVRTIANFVDHLSDDFDICIITSDRDRTMTEPYPNIQINDWNKVGSAEVFYLSPDKRTLGMIAKLMRETAYDVLYLNSFFDFFFTTLPLLARKYKSVPQKPCIIAPRGEFSQNAIKMKAWKKLPYQVLSDMIDLYAGLHWQASSKFEVSDIQRVMGKRARSIEVAPDLASAEALNSLGQLVSDAPISMSSPLRIVFLARITPIKNLDFAIRVLSQVRAKVSFSLYGPVVDKSYWKHCQDQFKSLPSNICVTYHGPVNHIETPQILKSSHLLFLPTLGENFGHVIAESVTQGTPVLISDQTPWRDLQQHGAGWDFPLSDPDQFTRQIEAIASMPAAAYATLRQTTLAFAGSLHASSAAIEKNRSLFLHALSLPAAPPASPRS